MSQALKTLLLQTFCIRTKESAQNDPDSKTPEEWGGEPATPTKRQSSPRPSTRRVVRPVTDADPETGEKLHNLTKFFMDEVKGADRPKFIQHLEATKHVQIAKVPESMVPEVETMIAEFAAGRPL